LTMPLTRHRPGRYQLRLELATEREDLEPDILLQARPIRDSVTVLIP